MDTDNARVMVKLAIGGKSVTISQYLLRLVPQKEYDKYSKDLSEHPDWTAFFYSQVKQWYRIK